MVEVYKVKEIAELSAAISAMPGFKDNAVKVDGQLVCALLYHGKDYVAVYRKEDVVATPIIGAEMVPIRTIITMTNIDMDKAECILRSRSGCDLGLKEVYTLLHDGAVEVVTADNNDTLRIIAYDTKEAVKHACSVAILLRDALIGG